jgi:hypothetical protein
MVDYNLCNISLRLDVNSSTSSVTSSLKSFTPQNFTAILNNPNVSNLFTLVFHDGRFKKPNV